MPSYTSPPKTWTTGSTVLAADMNTYISDAISALFPIGTYWDFHGAATSTETLVNGIWLQCNGVAVSRSTYADLNTHCSGLGYPDGSGNGTTTFNLPDFRGRDMIYHATSSGSTQAKTLGNTDGLALASRTPKPSVTVSGTTGSHTHGAGSFVIATGTVGAGSVGTTPAGGTPVSGTSGSSTATFSGSGTVAPGWIVGGMRYIKAFT